MDGFLALFSQYNIPGAFLVNIELTLWSALFSTILSVAQAGAGREGTASFAHATAVGGAWTFGTMILICLIGWTCLAMAMRIRVRRHASAKR